MDFGSRSGSIVDESATTASISRFENYRLLSTRDYRTEAGTEIGKKRWLTSPGEDDEYVAIRILVEAQGPTLVSRWKSR